MPRRVPLLGHFFGVSYFAEKPHVLSSVDGHAVFLWKRRMHRRFLIKTASWDAVSMESVAKVFIHIILRR